MTAERVMVDAFAKGTLSKDREMKRATTMDKRVAALDEELAEGKASSKWMIEIVDQSKSNAKSTQTKL